MQYYSIIGGLYLPFVTDTVIKILGPRRRAFGSAMIEFGDTIASFSAPVLNIIFKEIKLYKIKIMVVPISLCPAFSLAIGIVLLFTFSTE